MIYIITFTCIQFSSVQFILFPHGHLSQPQAVLPQVRAYKNSYITNSTRTYHTIGVHIKYNRMSNKQNNNNTRSSSLKFTITTTPNEHIYKLKNKTKRFWTRWSKVMPLFKVLWLGGSESSLTPAGDL